METLIAFAGLIWYTFFDALADASIFRWMTGKGEGYGQWIENVAAEENVDYNRRWHQAQALQQGGAIVLLSFIAGTVTFAPLAAALFWVFHDGMVNKVGLKRPWFYVGKTAWIDRQFQRFRKPELAQAVTKFALLLAGVALYVAEKVFHILPFLTKTAF